MAKKFVKVTGLHKLFKESADTSSLDTTTLKSDVTVATANSIVFIKADFDDESYGFTKDEMYIWTQGELYNCNNTAVGDFLPRSGGKMTGPLTWKDSTALPADTAGDYFLTVNSFANGGKTMYITKANAATALGLGSYLPLTSSTDQTVNVNDDHSLYFNAKGVTINHLLIDTINYDTTSQGIASIGIKKSTPTSKNSILTIKNYNPNVSTANPASTVNLVGNYVNIVGTTTIKSNTIKLFDNNLTILSRDSDNGVVSIETQSDDLNIHSDSTMTLSAEDGVAVDGSLTVDSLNVGNVDSNLTPKVDVTYSLGNSSARWNNIYCNTLFAASGGHQSSSDRRLKNINGEIDLDKAYDLIEKCSTIIYDLKSDETHRQQVGVIAQEIQEFFPEIVMENEDGFLSLDYSRLTVIILRVLKDLITRVSNLEKGGK